MRLAVLLRHTLPDGSSHHDWLIDLGTSAEGRLATWRTQQRPDLGESPVLGERLPDHRRVYLEYEGPISGDRGSVARLGSGRVLGSEVVEGEVGVPGRVRVRIAWDGGAEVEYVGRCEGGPNWRFEVGIAGSRG